MLHASLWGVPGGCCLLSPQGRGAPGLCPAHLSGLDDGEVVDVAEARSHGRAQPGRAEGEAAAQALPQLLVLPVLQQALDLLLRLLVLQREGKVLV